MKNWIQMIGFVVLALISKSALAQSEVNAYGPPRYTGGTVESPSETIALWQHNLQNSVKENSSPEIFQVYPNPATSTTRVVLESVPVSKTRIAIFNTNGVLVGSYQFAPGSARFDIDVSFLPTGIYSLQIQEEGKEAQSVQLSKY
jgi:hypothetical protein